MDENSKILIDIQAQVSSVGTKLDAFKEYYEHGRAAQIVKASQDEQHFKEIKDEIGNKVDKREVKPLLTLNWIMTNWKLAVFAIVILSSLGMISITSEVLKKLLQRLVVAP
jgi:hypothetical protein